MIRRSPASQALPRPRRSWRPSPPALVGRWVIPLAGQPACRVVPGPRAPPPARRPDPNSSASREACVSSPYRGPDAPGPARRASLALDDLGALAPLLLQLEGGLEEVHVESRRRIEARERLRRLETLEAAVADQPTDVLRGSRVIGPSRRQRGHRRP